MRLTFGYMVLLVLLVVQAPIAAEPTDTSDAKGTLPTDDKGQPLNLDFETGTLRDWKVEGEAFVGQPIQGDTVTPRRPGMASRHAGQFWLGGYEITKSDRAQGTLTSVPFKVTKPYARFLVGGGPDATTRVELIREDTKQAFFKASGDEHEDMKPVAVDLRPHLGQKIVIRVVDQHGGGWGHVNFDDFRFFDTKPVVPPRAVEAPADVFVNAGLEPEAAARAMTVPDGFKVTLFAGEPDVVQPIAQAFDDRGRLWVAEAYSYPRRLPDNEAHDRILIFEDNNNDGRFDKRTIFADHLNLVSGLEIGFGGVWVGAAPNLLFIPDKNHDDRPDGPPEVLLDGWGYQDSHETLNSFAWGPDGWLYGCHGVFTHSKVGKPGTPDADRVPLNAGIWRYHPTRHTFEVFAWGTSNPWGVDFDAHGEAFLTSCVIPHLYQVIQGARYERQAGTHFNPYTYDVIKTIADHRHYLGGNPHGGNGRSDNAGGGHAHAGAMIYQGGTWPDEYRGSIFMNNIHGARLNRDTLEPQGSAFVGQHSPDFLLANDRWSQIINLKYGPDGQVTLIDWYDKNQCHHNSVDGHDRTNGRIFKVSYGAIAAAPTDLAKETSAPLVATLRNRNQWHVRHALRLLQERGADPETRKRIAEELFAHRDAATRLRGLWAFHATGGLDAATVAKALTDDDPFIRAWTIQLSTEGGPPSTQTLGAFAALSRSDPSPVVRLYLASALQRIPLEQRWEILEGLVSHSEDAADHNLPLMAWYAAEPLVERDLARALALAEKSKVPQVATFLIRRIASLGTPEAIALLVAQLGRLDRADSQRTLLSSVNEALQGRRQVAMPPAWPEVYPALEKSPDRAVRDLAMALGLTFGDSAARRAMRVVLTNDKNDLGRRRAALSALVKSHDPELAPTLQSLLATNALRGEAIRGLAAYDDRRTPELLLETYPRLTPEERRDALNTLASRLEYARLLLESVGSARVSSKDLSADLIRQLSNLRNAEIDASIAKVWGTVRASAEDKLKLIASTKVNLTKKPKQTPDAMLGRAVFAKTCQQCHTLFGTGGRVGPDLTGSNRADLDYVLANVLDPSALIGKDYQAQVIATSDGRVLTGIVRAEDKDAITLALANETVTIPKGEVDQRRPSDQSMMPEGLWTPLSEHEVRSFLAYLASPAQVPMLATADNVAGFFNGRDLAGWEGNPSLWSVENGELVGKTPGLGRNEFLRSELAAEDFHFRVQVKLVANQGNSGIQFRSQSLPHGEVKGYQADVGAGWWGKLYEENGRALLWPKSGESLVKLGEWNTYEIIAVGSKIRTLINGKVSVDLDDPQGMRRGIFALQLHSGGATEVRYKDFKLELSPSLDAASGTAPAGK